MWLWLEFPADPERWASPCSSSSHHWLLASSLCCSFITWVLSIGSFFFVIYFLPSYLFLYICPFLLYTLVCAIFLFFPFFLVLDLCILLLSAEQFGLLHVMLKPNSTYLVSLMCCRLEDICSLGFYEEQHLWSVWIHAGFNGFQRWHVCTLQCMSHMHMPCFAKIRCFCLPK